MDLALDGSLAEAYQSRSQWARVVTEAWATRSMYCVACSSNHLTAHAANTKVEDFRCVRCNRRLQLKAKLGPVGRTVSNSAYASKLAAIRENRAPDYGFLSYDLSPAVTDLVVVPGHFLTESTISARKPLAPTARRAGWIGSNIHLDRIPPEGKITVVRAGVPVAPTEVRRTFQQTAFLREVAPTRRGWVTDVLACVDRLELNDGEEFHLRDLYRFEGKLHALHPKNLHIQEKIRQQVFLLRDQGVLESLGTGRYRRRVPT